MTKLNATIYVETYDANFKASTCDKMNSVRVAEPNYSIGEEKASIVFEDPEQLNYGYIELTKDDIDVLISLLSQCKSCMK